MSPTRIGFYHLTREPGVRALARLLERTLDAGKRALVLVPDERTLHEFDDALWLQDDAPWLPHGCPRTGDAERQPVWLDTPASLAAAPPPNRAEFLFSIAGAALAAPHAFERVFDLFDARREGEVEAARIRFRAARADGHEVEYWREGERGWEKPA